MQVVIVYLSTVDVSCAWCTKPFPNLFKSKYNSGLMARLHDTFAYVEEKDMEKWWEWLSCKSLAICVLLGKCNKYKERDKQKVKKVVLL